MLALLLYLQGVLMNIKFYQVAHRYIDYLSPHAPHLFHNKQPNQLHERKYIGIILQVNGFDYFAPLSSYKPKHDKIPEMIDFIKVKKYAVINLNSMFPVPLSECSYVDIGEEQDSKYRALLIAEYRYIKSIQDKIRKNALIIYKHKIRHGNSTGLAKRCNDFALLESLCEKYSAENINNG